MGKQPRRSEEHHESHRLGRRPSLEPARTSSRTPRSISRSHAYARRSGRGSFRGIAPRSRDAGRHRRRTRGRRCALDSRQAPRRCTQDLRAERAAGQSPSLRPRDQRTSSGSSPKTCFRIRTEQEEIGSRCARSPNETHSPSYPTIRPGIATSPPLSTEPSPTTSHAWKLSGHVGCARHEGELACQLPFLPIVVTVEVSNKLARCRVIRSHVRCHRADVDR